MTSLRSVAACGRCRTRTQGGGSAHVEVARKLREDGSYAAAFLGLQVCGNGWACAACARKIRARRAWQIQTCALRCLAEGGGVATGLLTIPHVKGQSLGFLWGRLTDLWRAVQGGNSWKRLCAKYGLHGAFKAFDLTHGDANGWHPHFHLLALFAGELSGEKLEEFQGEVYERARRVCRRKGWPAPVREATGWETVRTAEGVARYALKVEGAAVRSPSDAGAVGRTRSVAAETVRADTKAGGPFALLHFAIETGDCSLWHEYEAASKRRRVVTWPKTLREAYPDVLAPRVEGDGVADDVAEAAAAVEGEEIERVRLVEEELRALIEHAAHWPVLRAMRDEGGAAALAVLAEWLGPRGTPLQPGQTLPVRAGPE